MIVAYIVTLVVFLALDAAWLRLVIGPVFRRDVPQLLADDPDLKVAAGFYALYCVGIVYFAVAPAAAAGDPWLAAVRGAALGAVAYGCYEMTNKATLRGWTWRMVGLDVAWGAVLTAAAAYAGALAA